MSPAYYLVLLKVFFFFFNLPYSRPFRDYLDYFFKDSGGQIPDHETSAPELPNSTRGTVMSLLQRFYDPQEGSVSFLKPLGVFGARF